MARPTLIKFFLEPNEDEEITCLFCGVFKCEQSFQASGGGQSRIIGVHDSCAEKHIEKQLPKQP